jgi:outer membrane cobalamin receptor
MLGRAARSVAIAYAWKLLAACMVASYLRDSNAMAEEPDARGDQAHRYESTVTSTEASRKRESAEAVTVVNVDRAKRESADLGEVLSRVPGVSIARTGGLGSDVRFSLNGLSKDQIRFYLNGLPLEIAGFAFNLAAVPVNLIDRVEIYRGVVPLRFGADALGGAVNLVTPAAYYASGGSIAIQEGSFQTYRGSFTAHYRHASTGLFLAATGFDDGSANNYDVTVQVPDAQGRAVQATVPRFHDVYSSRGVVVDAGVVDRPWVKRLVLRAFYSEYDKQLQNNPVMTVPYGAVTYGESLAGVSLQALQPNALGHNVNLDVVGSYSHRKTDFNDTSSDVYNWFGNVIHMRINPGEIDGSPHLVTVWRDSLFARLGIEWKIAEGHALRLVSSTTYDLSHGISRAGILPGARDPQATARSLLKIVSGIEYQTNLFNNRLENVVFVKQYHVTAAADELLTGAVYVPFHVDQDTGGAGDGLRLRLYRAMVWVKGSYEYATRLPNTGEIFGDGILVQPNPSLAPEQSHNANLSAAFDTHRTRAGAFDGELNGFVRESSNLIVLLGNARTFGYQNVYTARALGIETSLHWLSPGDWVAVEASLTWQDIRNDSSSGAFAIYKGDRVPSMPWLFANTAVRAQYRGLFRPGAVVSVTWFMRYVHEFYRDWESIGAPQYKLTVDAQLYHTLSLAYSVRLRPVTLGVSVAVENVGDERLYDIYGVQRPGRAFYGKTTFDFN